MLRISMACLSSTQTSGLHQTSCSVPMHVLTGAGAYMSASYLQFQFPTQIKELCQGDINRLECFAILVALRAWGGSWGRSNILVNCDNLNSVRAINSGTSRDPIMQALLRNLHWCQVEFNCRIRAKFIEGVANREADSLSRWDNK